CRYLSPGGLANLSIGRGLRAPAVAFQRSVASVAFSLRGRSEAAISPRVAEQNLRKEPAVAPPPPGFLASRSLSGGPCHSRRRPGGRDHEGEREVCGLLWRCRGPPKPRPDTVCRGRATPASERALPRGDDAAGDAVPFDGAGEAG